jgi:hypothetical protein
VREFGQLQVFTDQSGTATTYMTVLSAGLLTLTAKLAPASYSNPQQVQTILLGTSSQLDLSLMTPPVWIAQGATVALPIAARVLSNGSPVSGTMLNYRITEGSGTLSAASVVTDSNGNASVSLRVNSLAASVHVNVCVAPNNTVCHIFKATIVQTSSLQLQPVSGMLQIASPGETLQPAAVRMIDSDTAQHPVAGVSIAFLAYIGRLPGNRPILWAGEAGVSQPSMPVILAKSQATVQSDINGIASFQLSTAGISGNVAIVGTATTGNNSVQFEAQQLGP